MHTQTQTHRQIDRHRQTHARTDSKAYCLDSAEGVDVSSCDGGHGCSQSLCQLCDLGVVKWPANSVQIQFKWAANLIWFEQPASSVQVQFKRPAHPQSEDYCAVMTYRV